MQQDEFRWNFNMGTLRLLGTREAIGIAQTAGMVIMGGEGL